MDRVLNAVPDYGYLAPHMLAHAEEYERMRHDCALSAQLAAAGSAATPGPHGDVDDMRRRLGEILMRMGTRLQGSPPVEPGIPGQVSSAGSWL
jgi:hypothetical protein